MKNCDGKRGHAGFSLIEMMIVMTIMIVITGSVLALMRDSIRVSVTATEMTDAQESLRTAHEYISRDLLTAGDGLKSINNILLRRNFVTGFLTSRPVPLTGTGNMSLPIVTSDNDVPAGTLVPGSSPSVSVRSNPQPTDRLTLLQVDRSFTPVTLATNVFNAAGSSVTVPAGDIGRINIGEIYFITSSTGGTFGVVTAKDSNARTLNFALGDPYGLNFPGVGGPINVISGGGTLGTSMMRMRIINYFVGSNGLLIRRVYGVGGGVGFNDNVIAEHVTNLQFRYILSLPSSNGFLLQPVMHLSTSQQQVAIRQVEVNITTETVHQLHNNQRQQITMTTNTAVRNMQFRQALQPTGVN